jgi:hypothetical protein
MRQDIDYLDCKGDEEDLLYDEGWLTPSFARGYRKLRLTNSISVYYRYQGTAIRYDLVLSFDSFGAHAPKSYPILHTGYGSMLEVWEKLGKQTEDDAE